MKDKNIILCPYCAYVFTGGGYEKLERISPGQNGNTQQKSQYKSKIIYGPKPLCEYFGVAWPDPDEVRLNENYIKMIKEYHPDKVNTLGIELRNLAEEKSKEINTNYQRLQKIINPTENK